MTGERHSFTIPVMPDIRKKEWYTVIEVAEYFQVDDSTVRRWIRDGRLPAKRGNLRKYVVSAEAIKQFEKLLEN